jgi:transposase
MTDYYIALDVHCAFSEMAVVTGKGKVVTRDQLNTSVRELRKAIEDVHRPRRLTFEEGPLADWLARELRGSVDELVVCEPRRNRWIAREGDKDDPLDARKLADLYRGGYLKAVHHPDSLKRSILKQQVSLYHDRVRERVRQGNQLVALWRRHGVFVSAARLQDDAEWTRELARLPDSKPLRRGIELVRETYLMLIRQEESLRGELIGQARNFEPVRRFTALPGVGWIRGVTFFAYVDTPHRFASKACLWRYANIGLERRHSGRGPTQTRLSAQGNRRLKDVLIGAAQSAIWSGENPFAQKYDYWTKEQGLSTSKARRNVARAIATTLWSLWKTGETFDPERVVGSQR